MEFGKCAYADDVSDNKEIPLLKAREGHTSAARIVKATLC
jgi:hypothetical protein